MHKETKTAKVCVFSGAGFVRSLVCFSCCVYRSFMENFSLDYCNLSKLGVKTGSYCGKGWETVQVTAAISTHDTQPLKTRSYALDI